jgi:hypothetical protein
MIAEVLTYIAVRRKLQKESIDKGTNYLFRRMIINATDGKPTIEKVDSVFNKLKSLQEEDKKNGTNKSLELFAKLMLGHK